MPVEVTAMKNLPSKRGSRLRRARSSTVGSNGSMSCMGADDTRERRRELAISGREGGATAVTRADGAMRGLRGGERCKYEWGVLDRWSTRRLLPPGPANA
jgi:hypothetical protein